MRDWDVLALGELNLDLVLTGLKSMPVPGHEILAQRHSLVLGSSTAICAAAMAGLGLDTHLLAKTGQDLYARRCLELLKELGVDSSLVHQDPDTQTGVTISLSYGEDRALVTYLGAIAALRAEEVDCEVFRRVKHVHVGSFFLQSALRPGLAELFRKAHEAGATTSLDAGWDDAEVWDYGIREVLRHTDVFFPNELEAAAVTGRQTIPEAARELARYARHVVVKCGGDGAYLVSGDKELQLPAYRDIQVVDTTGAGDSFNAGFLYGFVHGLPLEVCMEYGNACAAISITRLGGAAQCATLEEVHTIIEPGRL